MSTATPPAAIPTAASLPVHAHALEVTWRAAERSLLSKARDYVELAKPRISVLVLVTVAVGFLLAPAMRIDLVLLCWTLFGVGAVGTASNTINQVLEREFDRLMPRTANRPLPSGRLTVGEGWMFGLLSAAIGLSALWTQVNPLTSALTAATLLLYVGCYTPLKRRTALCTTVGAVPGALPPVLGWVAAGGSLDAQALALFGILFLWQFPHFLAIAWLHQEQYHRAGMKMLPAGGKGRLVGAIAVSHAAALVVVSLWPRALGMAGGTYAAAAVVLGAAYLMASILFWKDPGRLRARRLLWTSLYYLPCILAILTWDHLRLLS
jgi:protoheme IX farnesyltransferase